MASLVFIVMIGIAGGTLIGLEIGSLVLQQMFLVVEQILSKLPGKVKSDFLRWIKTQTKDSVRLIPVEEADYFKAEDKYTLVVTKEGESLIKKSIKELAQELDPGQFWQIHRGTLRATKFWISYICLKR